MTTDISQVPVELWNVEDVHPYPYNNKIHPEKHIELLMRSIKTQGHLDPIVVDRDGVIISGHGRFEAIKRLGRTKVAIRCLRDITEEQAAALRIAANKTVSNDYDTDILSKELARLKDLDVDLGSLGFDERELSMLIEDVGKIDTDSVVADMNEAINNQTLQVAAQAEQTDQQDVRLDRVLGFKHIRLTDSKTVARFMAEIEASTGAKGAEALIKHMKEYLEAA